jgi:nitrogen fixation NifU-like protein
MTEDFSDLRDLYQDIILDRGRNPRHMRRMEPFDASAHRDNPLCGDRVEVRVRLSTDGDVAEIAFEGRGCAISLASADLMAEAALGRSATEIRSLATAFGELAATGDAPHGDPALEILRPFAGVSDYKSRIKCATLPWTALVAGLDELATGDRQ